MADSAHSILAPANPPAGPNIELTRKGEAYAAAHARVREEIEEQIESLIAALDAYDDDPDLEPSLLSTDDLEGGNPEDVGEPDDWEAEPSLGAPEIPPTQLVRGGPHGWQSVGGSQEHWADGSGFEGEQDDGEEPEQTNEDGGDINDEPQGAGWSEAGSLRGVLQSGHSDDYEPSLGWTNSRNQAGRNFHGQSRLWPSALDGEAEHDGREPDDEGGIDDEPHDDLSMDLEEDYAA